MDYTRDLTIYKALVLVITNSIKYRRSSIEMLTEKAKQGMSIPNANQFESCVPKEAKETVEFLTSLDTDRLGIFEFCLDLIWHSVVL